MKASFLKIDEIKDILEKTAGEDKIALRMLPEIKKKLSGQILNKTIPEEIPKGKVIPYIITEMADYISGYKASQIVRQQMWDSCNAWLSRIAETIGAEYTAEMFAENVSRPVDENPYVALIKALHDKDGKTKAELKEILGVSEKTIQTNLRALDNKLCEDNCTAQQARIAGQKVEADIRCVEKEHGQRYYSMPDRIHPIILQLNTMQVGVLLTALQQYNNDYDSAVSKTIAEDLWWQLSQSGKERIFEIFGKKDHELKDFLDDMESEQGRTWPEAFVDESRLLEEGTSNDEMLHLAFKGGYLCSFRIRTEDGIKAVKRHRVYYLFESPGRWKAVPEKCEKNSDEAIFFGTEDLLGFIEVNEI